MPWLHILRKLAVCRCSRKCQDQRTRIPNCRITRATSAKASKPVPALAERVDWAAVWAEMSTGTGRCDRTPPLTRRLGARAGAEAVSLRPG